MLKKMLFTMILLMFIICLVSTVSDAFYVSSPFGWRNHPIKGNRHFHTGIDIPAQQGTPIAALFDGDVIWANVRGGYGNAVIIRHADNRYTLYGHCNEIKVTLGETVKAGDIIATVGTTGVSTGPHLHLEYWVNGKYVDPMVIWKTEKKKK